MVISGSWFTFTTDPKNTSDSRPSRFVFFSLVSSLVVRGLEFTKYKGWCK